MPTRVCYFEHMTTYDLPTTTRYLGFAIFPVWNEDRTEVEAWDVHAPCDLVWNGRTFTVSGDPIATTCSKEEACEIIRAEAKELKFSRMFESGNVHLTFSRAVA